MRTNPIRFILSITLGVVLSYFISVAIQSFIPPLLGEPALKEGATTADFTAYMHNLSNAAIVFHIISYIAGAFFGGYLSARFSKERKVESSIAVGLFITIVMVFMLVVFPPPLIMAVPICILLLPTAYLGGRLGA